MADDSQFRAQVESSEPEELFVAEQRRRLVQTRHAAGDDDYEYPAHLIGPGAAGSWPWRQVDDWKPATSDLLPAGADWHVAPVVPPQ